MKKTWIFIAVLLPVLAGALNASEAAWSAAAGGGFMTEQKHSGVSNNEEALLGLELTRQMNKRIDLAFGFSYYDSQKEYSRTPGVKYGYHNYFFTICGIYKPYGRLKGFYGGPQLAWVTRTLISDPDNVDMGSAGYGLRAGYEHALGGHFRAGIQGNYLKAGSAENTVTSGSTRVTYKVPETSYTGALLSVKYSF